MQLEIAVVDIAGVGIAADEAADRIEPCTRLDLGGLTGFPRSVSREPLQGWPAFAGASVGPVQAG